MHARLGAPALAIAIISVTAGLAAPAGAVVTRVRATALLAEIPTRSESTAGYDRSAFRHWVDADRNGCDTRAEVLIAESNTRPAVGTGCTISGGRWISKYDKVRTTAPSGFDVDHLVPLAEAWQSGADQWDADTRMRYANDLGYANSLIAVTASSNRSKGDREPQNWMPAYWRCNYVATWIAVKWRWQLAVDATERGFLESTLATCNNPSVVRPDRAPVT